MLTVERFTNVKFSVVYLALYKTTETEHYKILPVFSVKTALLTVERFTTVKLSMALSCIVQDNRNTTLQNILNVNNVNSLEFFCQLQEFQDTKFQDEKSNSKLW